MKSSGLTIWVMCVRISSLRIDVRQRLQPVRFAVAVNGVGINPGDITATMISTAPPTAVHRQGVTIVAKVTDTQTGHRTSIPTRSVTFTDTFGATVSQLKSVSFDASENARLTGVLLTSVEAHTMAASYAGVASAFVADNNNGAVTEPPVQPVQMAAGQPGTIVVTIAGAYNTPSAPSGSISYSILNAANASVSSGTAPLVAGGGSSSASVPVSSALAAGTYTVRVTYAGDSNYEPNPTAILIPLHIGQINPTIAWSAGGTISYGTSLSRLLTATASSTGFGVPGVFAYTATPAGGTASPVSSATLLGEGNYQLSAIFTPSDTTTYKTAAATAMLVVARSSVSTSLFSSVNPSIATSPVMFTATADSSISTPTGTMSFYDGTAFLGAVVLGEGRAVYATSSLGAGSHSITAAYSGDNNFSSTTSVGIVQAVQDFTLSSSSSGLANSPTETILPGGTVTYALTLSPTAGTVFPAAVNLSVSGLPAGATATFSSQTIPAGWGQTPITLTIQVPNRVAQLGGGFGVTIPALTLLLLPFAGWRRRSGRTRLELGFGLLLLVAAGGAAAGLSGCGTTSRGFFGQAGATYDVVITATSGTLSHTTSVTLTVQ